jgi:hypothetical protein
MTSYPGAIASFTTKTDGVDYPQAAHINSLQNEVVAIETALGTNFAVPTYYKISPTVVANDLVLTITHMDGTTPSVSRPLNFIINSTVRACTAALSVTKADATNWANLGSAELATKEADLFTYVVWNTNLGAVDVLWSRVPYANIYSEFSATTTDEKYGAINATAPASTDNVVNIGRFACTLSAGAGYTFSVPTFTSVNLVQRPTFETRLLSYIPTITNVTLGNGTKTGVYFVSNYLQKFWFSLTLGSTTSFASTYVAISVPFTPTGHEAYDPVGSGFLFDTGTASYDMKVRLLNTGPTLFFTCWNTAGTYATAASVAAYRAAYVG